MPAMVFDRAAVERYTWGMPRTPQRPSIEVGVRELRDHLSAWLERVQQGEELIVTERGKPIARIGSTGGRGSLDRLISEGVVTPASKPRAPASSFTTVRMRTGTVAELVAAQRR